MVGFLRKKLVLVAENPQLPKTAPETLISLVRGMGGGNGERGYKFQIVRTDRPQLQKGK